jgi:hypothetical protein
VSNRADVAGHAAMSASPIDYGQSPADGQTKPSAILNETDQVFRPTLAVLGTA